MDRNGSTLGLPPSVAMSDPALNVEPAAVQHDGEMDADDGAQRALFKALYVKSEARIAALFGGEAADGEEDEDAAAAQHIQIASGDDASGSFIDTIPKKSARTIDEDDYDDDEEEEEEDRDEEMAPNALPLLSKGINTFSTPSKPSQPFFAVEITPPKSITSDKDGALVDKAKASEDARKQLEKAKKATEEAAKRSMHTMFYTLENDRIAMLEQQKLEESERQVDAEMDNGASTSNPANGEAQHGTLSSANLGASSLTLKHLIARIDMKRDQVRASDAELRTLMSEVRKNRSKWANEEQVGQEELYEAAEKVLSELKAMTEYSAPFLQRVNKRDAPDYANSMFCLHVLRAAVLHMLTSIQSLNSPWISAP